MFSTTLGKKSKNHQKSPQKLLPCPTRSCIIKNSSIRTQATASLTDNTLVESLSVLKPTCAQVVFRFKRTSRPKEPTLRVGSSLIRNTKIKYLQYYGDKHHKHCEKC